MLIHALVVYLSSKCRCLFVLHSVLCVWRVAVTQSSSLYYILGLPYILVIAESLYVFIRRDGKEWKW